MTAVRAATISVDQPPFGRHVQRSWQQIGCCVYCTGCLTRLYQGTAPRTGLGRRIVARRLDRHRRRLFR